jgi:hypothetical protein
VDGAELLILEGSRSILPQCSTVVVEAGIKDFTARSKPLEDAGFELFDVVDLAYYDERLAQFDMVWVNTKMMQTLKLEMYKNGFDYSKWATYQPS